MAATKRNSRPALIAVPKQLPPPPDRRPRRTGIGAPLQRKKELEAMNADELSVVDQVWLATRRENIPATIGGFLLGGLVPLMSFMEAHYDLTQVWYQDPKVLLVAGGLIFSFYTVFQWGQKAFLSQVKAFGFVMLVEGTMVFSRIEWLAITALVFLIAINGIATGVALALAKWRPNRAD